MNCTVFKLYIHPFSALAPSHVLLSSLPSTLSSFYLLSVKSLQSSALKTKNKMNVRCCNGNCLCLTDQLRNSYQVGNDHSLRVIYANGMDTHYQTEPHILAGMQF